MEGTITYRRKSYHVEAIRLTRENMRDIAEQNPLRRFEYAEETDVLGKVGTTPHIRAPYSGYGFLGDWLVIHEDIVEFYTNQAFTQKFVTISEELSADEKYAMVFQLVIAAMNKQGIAVFNGDGNGETDLVAAEAAKRILQVL